MPGKKTGSKARVELAGEEAVRLRQLSENMGLSMTAVASRLLRDKPLVWIDPAFYTTLLGLYQRVEQMDSAILRCLNADMALRPEQIRGFLAAHDEISAFLSLVARGEVEAFGVCALGTLQGSGPIAPSLGQEAEGA